MYYRTIKIPVYIFSCAFSEAGIMSGSERNGFLSTFFENSCIICY